MRTGIPYKQNMRQSRIQEADEVFLLGMQYSNAPIGEGLSRILLNYDTDTAGEILTPRPGIRAEEFAVDAGVDPKLYDAGMAIFAGKSITSESSEDFRQVIIGKPSETKLEASRLYTGTGFISTILIEEAVAGELIEYPMTLSAMQDDTKAGYIYFTRPETAEIHGILLQDVTNIAKHVGTYAFNNMYYWFDHTTTVVGEVTTEAYHLCHTVLTNGGYVREAIVPKEVSPTEAVQWGYNMLKENPYDFSNTEFNGMIQLLGLLPYDENGDIIMNPLLNQKLKFEAFYAGNSSNSYVFKWEWKETGGTQWTTLSETQIALTGLPEVSIDFSSPAANIIIQLSAYKVNGGIMDTLVEKVIAMGISFIKEENKNNVQMQYYDLSRASGMCYWKNRLVLWGLPDAALNIFMSDINDPSYFPFPNCADIFDEPVIHAMPLNDALLVFTSSCLYIITLGMDGIGWTKKKIQSNLNINPWDIHLIQSVKSMVFFKSGNYYYMVVPSKTLVDQLVVAPVSKNLMTLFDNFEQTVQELFKSVYDYQGTLELVHYYNFLDFEDVHNVYVFKTESGLYLNLVLLYSTISRAWRMYTVESDNILLSFQQDMTKPGILMTLTPVEMPGTNIVPCIQFLRKNYKLHKDFYLPAGTLYTGDETFMGLAEAGFEAMHEFRNWQYLDTGYRDQVTGNKKRYRELQFKFNNLGSTSLEFYTDFFIDGESRRSMAAYELHQEVDPLDPAYGLITMERLLVDPSILPGATILAENSTEWNHWALDTSVFPDIHFWKIRIGVSGKGYTPRMRFMSMNEESYEILDITWIYRMMNAR